MIQISIFDMIREPIRITKPIRLIELFAGYGSQAMALERIGAKFEHYRVVEFDKYAIASYNAVHGTNFPTMDITKVHAEDLDICDTEFFTYLLTYLLVSLYRFIGCRETSRHEKRKWDQVWSFVGSRKDSERDKGWWWRITTDSVHGERTAGPCQCKYGRFSELDRFSNKPWICELLAGFECKELRSCTEP